MTPPNARSTPPDVHDLSLAELIEELAGRLQGHESFDLGSLLREHPERAEEVRELLPTIRLLAKLGSSGPEAWTGVAGGQREEHALGRLGDYLLIREAGRGGMGVVYEAEQISLGRRVALKVLPFAATLDPRQLQRFHNEARAAAGLDHPHIVSVYGVGCERGVHYYSMRLIDGQTLSRHIAQLRREREKGGRAPVTRVTLSGPTQHYTPPPPDAEEGGPEAARERATRASASGRDWGFFRMAARLGAQVGEALHHAHEVGVVHRDVKPANILLDGRGHAWVADFGLAQLEAGSGLTMTGDVLGTLRYMSPEQAAGRRALVDRRADIYGLGITLYELLTLRPAFPEGSRGRLLRQVIHDEPPPPRAIDPSIPKDLETVVLKATAKEPDARYPTAREMAEDLRRFADGEPIRARRAGVTERVVRWCRRYPARASLVAVVALAVLTLIPGGMWLAAALDNARIARELAAAERREKEQAQKAEAVTRYFFLLERARQRGAGRQLGWTWHGLCDLEEAARLPSEPKDPVALRTEVAACLAEVDLREEAVLAEEFCAAAVAFSPDGRYLAVAQHKEWNLPDGVILLFDWPARKVRRRMNFPLHRKEGSADGGSALAFSRDGGRLALGTRSGWIHTWDLTGPGPDLSHTQWKVDREEIVWLAFGEDGDSLYADSRLATLSRWNARGEELARLERGTFRCLPALRGQALVCHWNGGIRTFRAQDLRPIRDPYPLKGGSCRFSPDGRILAVERGRRIVLVDARTGEELCTLKDPRMGQAHEFSFEMQFSADGSLLVTSCGHNRDRTLKLWEVAGGRLLATLLPGSTGPLVAALSPDGGSLVVAANGRVVLHQVGGLREQTFFAQHTRPLRGVRFSPCGQSLACVAHGGKDDPEGDGEITLWGVADGRLRGRREQQPGQWVEHLGPLAFHPRGTALASCGWKRGIDLWDLAGGEERSVRFGPQPGGDGPPPGVPLSLSFSPDGTHLWAALEAEGVRSWTWPDCDEDAYWSGPPGPDDPVPTNMYHVAAGKHWVLAAGQDGAARLLRPRDGRPTRTWPRLGGPVRSVALSSDERLAAWGDQEGVVRIARTDDGQVLADLKDHQDTITGLAFGPSGKLLVTGSRDATVRLYLRSGEGFVPLLTLRSCTGPVQALDLSPDGRKLALVVRQESAVRLWHLDRLRERLAGMGLDEPDWPAFGPTPQPAPAGGEPRPPR